MRWEARPSQGAVRSFLVLLASSSSNLQLTLWLFASKCEGAGMRISTKAEAMVLSWNGGMSTMGWWWAVASSGRVQVPLGLVHKWGNQGVRIWQIDWCSICSKVDAVMACCGKERVLSLKTKLSIYQSVRVLTLICGHKWLVTKRLRSKYLSIWGSTASLWHCFPWWSALGMSNWEEALVYNQVTLETLCLLAGSDTCTRWFH